MTLTFPFTEMNLFLVFKLFKGVLFMDILFTLIFVPAFIVWVLFQNIGKGGFIDEALSSGLLVMRGQDKEIKDKEE